MVVNMRTEKSTVQIRYLRIKLFLCKFSFTTRNTRVQQFKKQRFKHIVIVIAGNFNIFGVEQCFRDKRNSVFALLFFQKPTKNYTTDKSHCKFGILILISNAAYIKFSIESLTITLTTDQSCKASSDFAVKLLIYNFDRKTIDEFVKGIYFPFPY